MNLSLYTQNKWLDTVFDDFFNSPAASENRTWNPASDIHDNGKSYVVEMEMPGVKKEDVKIEVRNNVLSIEGTSNNEKKVDRKDYYLSERSYGTFRRSFNLSDAVNAESINAELKDGVLTLELPKREEAKPKQINVK